MKHHFTFGIAAAWMLCAYSALAQNMLYLYPKGVWTPIASAISDCRVYSSRLPQSASQVSVFGNLVNGKCKFIYTEGLTQTTCLFTEAQRKEIKAQGGAAIQQLLRDPATCGEAAQNEADGAINAIPRPTKPGEGASLGMAGAAQVMQAVQADAAGNVTTTTHTVSPGVDAMVSITQSPQEAAATNAAGAAFKQALATCSPSETSMPHPIMAGFTIKIKVHGMQDGKCKYTQTMPNNGLQTCNLTDQQREAVRTRGDEALAELAMDEQTCVITGY